MADTKEYLYVMDYSDCTISKIELDEDDDDLDSIDLLAKYGFKESECAWMFSTNDINTINFVSTDYKHG